MTQHSLDTFIQDARAAWGPLTTDVVARLSRLVEGLARTPPSEPWLAALLSDPRPDRELYRDPDHGFLLLAHIERVGHYRVPHDHGRGWVIYAVQHGEMETGGFALVTDDAGARRLVRRDISVVRTGDCRVYLPGDVHDTLCVSPDVLYFRFTSCDFKREDREGRLNRYPGAPDRS